MKRKHPPIMSMPVIQSGDQTINNTIHRKWLALALGGFLFASLLALSPSPVKAYCPQGYDVTGMWGLKQSNQAAPNVMELEMDSSGQITGRASYPTTAVGNYMTGVVKGRVSYSMIELEISWKNNLTGIYSGMIGSNRMITGTAYEKSTPSTKVSWSSDKGMRCRETNPPPTRPPPIKRTGRMPKPAVTPIPIAPTSDTAPAPTRKVPWIIADSKPGITTLTWDAGPDHPYAEVWVKVNDQDEKFVVEKGKGTRQVTVEPGNIYLYILSDSGKQLATVTVTGQQ